MPGSRVKHLNLFLVPWEESIHNQDPGHHPRGILESFTEASKCGALSPATPQLG